MVKFITTFKGIGLKLENQDWILNKAKGNTIQLHILNRSFTYTARIKKSIYWFYIFIR